MCLVPERWRARALAASSDTAKLGSCCEILQCRSHPQAAQKRIKELEQDKTRRTSSDPMSISPYLTICQEGQGNKDLTIVALRETNMQIQVWLGHVGKHSKHFEREDSVRT